MHEIVFIQYDTWPVMALVLKYVKLVLRSLTHLGTKGRPPCCPLFQLLLMKIHREHITALFIIYKLDCAVMTQTTFFFQNIFWKPPQPCMILSWATVSTISTANNSWYTQVSEDIQRKFMKCHCLITCFCTLPGPAWMCAQQTQNKTVTMATLMFTSLGY